MTIRFDEDIYEADGVTIRDGKGIRVRLDLIDGHLDDVQRSVAANVTDAREAAFARRDAFMKDAWRNPSAREPQPTPVARPVLVPPTLSARTTIDARDAALATREARLRDAWKMPSARNVV